MPRYTKALRPPPDIDEGPPLHLERPGAITEHLSPFVRPQRVERLRDVAARRTRYLTALVEGVHDPHNLSACIRSCDAFGLQQLHIVPEHRLPFRLSPVIASGATRWVTVHIHDTVEQALEVLHAEGYRVAATDLGGETEPTPVGDVRVDAPLCIAFGNEHEGISQTLRDACDERVRIPMYGFVESFNISVAFALAVGNLRERAIKHTGKVGDLTPGELTLLLDRWLYDDVPRAPSVLRELARRASS